MAVGQGTISISESNLFHAKAGSVWNNQRGSVRSLNLLCRGHGRDESALALIDVDDAADAAQHFTAVFAHLHAYHLKAHHDPVGVGNIRGVAETNLQYERLLLRQGNERRLKLLPRHTCQQRMCDMLKQIGLKKA